MHNQDEELQQLACDLTDLFAETIHIDDLQQTTVNGMRLCVVQMSYVVSNSSQMKTVRQTVVYVDDPAVHVPDFAMWPHFKGVAGKLFAAVGSMVDINFADSPAFSAEYHLFGWNDEAVRQLFSPEIREYLGEHRGWSARGKQTCLAVFQQNQVIDSEQLDSFLEDALKILTLLRSSEKAMDDRPELRRNSSVDDLLVAAEKMGGFHELAIKNTLKREAVGVDAVDEFLSQSAPRSRIPIGLRRQVVGENLVVKLLGVVFLVAGIFVPTLLYLLLSGNERWFALPVAGVFLLAGSLILYFILGHERRKKRLVRDGLVARGRITKVQPTNVEINGARRYHVFIDFVHADKPNSIRSNIYAGIEKAQYFAKSGETVRLLVDPQDPSHVVCVDLLLITS
jgi:hypothetical protein